MTKKRDWWGMESCQYGKIFWDRINGYVGIGSSDLDIVLETETGGFSNADAFTQGKRLWEQYKRGYRRRKKHEKKTGKTGKTHLRLPGCVADM